MDVIASMRRHEGVLNEMGEMAEGFEQLPERAVASRLGSGVVSARPRQRRQVSPARVLP